MGVAYYRGLPRLGFLENDCIEEPYGVMLVNVSASILELRN